MTDQGETTAKATLDYVMDLIAGERFKDELGNTADWYVRYSLGQSAAIYHVEGFAEIAAERDRLREALLEARYALRDVTMTKQSEAWGMAVDSARRAIKVVDEALSDAPEQSDRKEGV